MKTEDRSNRLVRLSEDTHLRLRLAAARLDVTFGEAVARALDALEERTAKEQPTG
ncbi:hypothetical protein WMF27_20635 [Sorangium sp. So ce281]|uniref:hypothetical protein n=1 Tax=unclassified Sorangium TaxID=2621164 RepID=UPI003F5DDF0C